MDESGLAHMRTVDWANSASLVRSLPSALEAMAASRPALRHYVEAETLKIERFPNFYKLVLAEFDNGTSLRLHLFPRPGVGSRHSHRWIFGARVLAGRLRHVLFEEDVVYEKRIPGTESPVMSRIEFPDCSYVLWPSHVHSVEALEPALTLVARGPETRTARFVDIPGVERGWARRYKDTNRITAGEKISGSERDQAIGGALLLLSADHDPNVPVPGGDILSLGIGETL